MNPHIHLCQINETNLFVVEVFCNFGKFFFRDKTVVVSVQRLEGEMSLAGDLDVGHHLVLVLVQTGEHLGVTTVTGEPTLADLDIVYK